MPAIREPWDDNDRLSDQWFGPVTMLVDIRKWYTASRAISIRAGRDLLMSPDGARRHGFEVALVLITVAALLPYFAGGDPPGVDAPTFLHFAWVLEQSFHGSPAGFLDDPWWYGGLPYLQAYSPGGYGLVGLAAALSPMEIAASFKLVMAVAFAATAVLTFRLGRTLGLRPLFAFTGAALLVLSYPVLSGIGLYGWLPTMASMPLALAAVIALEKWIARGGVKLAVITGAFIGMSLVAHHMTAIAFRIVIAVRLGMLPERSSLSLFRSDSRQRTWWPNSAKHAEVTRPTYPPPTTLILAMFCTPEC